MALEAGTEEYIRKYDLGAGIVGGERQQQLDHFQENWNWNHWDGKNDVAEHSVLRAKENIRDYLHQAYYTVQTMAGRGMPFDEAARAVLQAAKEYSEDFTVWATFGNTQGFVYALAQKCGLGAEETLHIDPVTAKSMIDQIQKTAKIPTVLWG